MKKCPYCDKEYPDDATVCVVDTTVLVDNPPKPAVEAVKSGPVESTPYLKYPDYQWSARDAWKCIGILVCLTFVVFAIDDITYRIVPHFYLSGVGFICHGILLFATWIVTACYFARTETFAAFWEGFGFNRKPTSLVWFGMTMALLLRFVDLFMLSHKWGRGVHNYELESFYHTVGFQKWLFQFSPLVLAPIFEEAVNRGFLFKAFRRSYSLTLCMILMVGWTGHTHWSYYRESWIAVWNLSAWTILQCYLREKSPSLWDCVLCHFIFNASILFMGRIPW